MEYLRGAGAADDGDAETCAAGLAALDGWKTEVETDRTFFDKISQENRLL